MESQQFRTESVFWSTVSKLSVAVPIATLVGAGLSALVMGGIDYGQLRTSLDVEKNRTTELRKANDELRESNDNLRDLLEKWREAVAQRDTIISTTQAKLTAMQNDQCEAIRKVIDDLEDALRWADARQMSNIRRAEVNQLVSQHQQSLQSCFATRR